MTIEGNGRTLCEDNAQNSALQTRSGEAGLTKTGYTADEVVHIGDSYSADYLGARESGIRSILIDRKNKDPHDCEKATDLREILTMIIGR